MITTYDNIILVDMIKLKAKVGKRGQLVIPKPIRDMFNINPADEVYFRVEDDKIIIESKDPEKIFEEYISEIKKKEEPEKIDWDSEYYSQIGD